MEAGGGSSKPPPNIHLVEEEGDESIIRHASDKGRSETEDSQMTPGPSGLLTRPLAKIRYKSTRILQDRHPLIKACNKKDSDTPSGEILAAGVQARDVEDVRRQCDALDLERAEEVDAEDEKERLLPVADQLVRLYESGDTNYITSKEDLKAKIELYEEWGELYREYTTEAHEELTNQLRTANLIADQVYEEIHATGELRLSNFENVLPNEYILYLIESGKIKPGSLTLEFGSGGGKDARTIAQMVENAQVNGVDISPTAVRAGNSLSQKEGLGGRVKFAEGNFLHMADACIGQPYDNIYINSAGHYQVGKKAEQLYKVIGNILRVSGGRLHNGMKIRKGSASANSPHQIRMAPGHPDNPMVDVRHFNPKTGKGAILRLYRETQERIHQVQQAGGLIIEESQIRDVANYDRSDQKERFVWTTSRAA